MPLLGKFMGTSKIRGTGVLSSIGLYVKNLTVRLFFWMLEKIVWAEVVVESLHLYQGSC